jgi:hypothetical protein
VKTSFLTCLFILGCGALLNAQQVKAPEMLRPGMAPVIPESTPSTATVDKLAEEAQKSLFQAADQSGGAAPTTSNAPNTTTGPMRLPSPVAGSPALWENDSQHKLAVMEVAFGGRKETVMIELFTNDAPQTVANFIDRCDSGFYNGLAFHRAIEGFIVQTGRDQASASHRRGRHGTAF